MLKSDNMLSFFSFEDIGLKIGRVSGIKLDWTIENGLLCGTDIIGGFERMAFDENCTSALVMGFKLKDGYNNDSKLDVWFMI